MGDKQKTKCSKPPLTRKSICQDHRQKSKEPVDTLSHLSQFVEPIPLLNVLDIKIEEPEVASYTEEDCPSILLDHSYSRTPIKQEPCWFATEATIATTPDTSVHQFETQNYDESSPNAVTSLGANNFLRQRHSAINISGPSTSSAPLFSSLSTIAIKSESVPNPEEEEKEEEKERDFCGWQVASNERGFTFRDEHNYTRPFPLIYYRDRREAQRQKEMWTQTHESPAGRGRGTKSKGRGGLNRQFTSSESASEAVEPKSCGRRRGTSTNTSKSRVRRSSRLGRPKDDLPDPSDSGSPTVYVLKFANPDDLDILTKASEEQNELYPKLLENIASGSGSNTNLEAAVDAPIIPSIVISKKNIVSKEQILTQTGASTASNQLVVVSSLNKKDCEHVTPPNPSAKPQTKKHGGTLRVKTQDELNAAAASLEPVVSKSSSPSVPESNGDAYIVLENSKRGATKKLILPVDRSLQPVPHKWKQKFVDQQLLSDEGPLQDKMTKDVTGRRFKNRRKQVLEPLPNTEGDEIDQQSPPEEAVINKAAPQRRSPRILNFTLSKADKDKTLEFDHLSENRSENGQEGAVHVEPAKAVPHWKTPLSGFQVADAIPITVLPQVTVQNEIVERVDNVIQNLLADTDDIEEVDVLRVDLRQESTLQLPGPNVKRVSSMEDKVQRKIVPSVSSKEERAEVILRKTFDLPLNAPVRRRRPRLRTYSRVARARLAKRLKAVIKDERIVSETNVQKVVRTQNPSGNRFSDIMEQTVRNSDDIPSTSTNSISKDLPGSKPNSVSPMVGKAEEKILPQKPDFTLKVKEGSARVDESDSTQASGGKMFVVRKTFDLPVKPSEKKAQPEPLVHTIRTKFANRVARTAAEKQSAVSKAVSVTELKQYKEAPIMLIRDPPPLVPISGLRASSEKGKAKEPKDTSFKTVLVENSVAVENSGNTQETNSSRDKSSSSSSTVKRRKVNSSENKSPTVKKRRVEKLDKTPSTATDLDGNPTSSSKDLPRSKPDVKSKEKEKLLPEEPSEKTNEGTLEEKQGMSEIPSSKKRRRSGTAKQEKSKHSTAAKLKKDEEGSMKPRVEMVVDKTETEVTPAPEKASYMMRILEEDDEESSLPQIRMQDLEEIFGPRNKGVKQTVTTKSTTAEKGEISKGKANNCTEGESDPPPQTITAKTKRTPAKRSKTRKSDASSNIENKSDRPPETGADKNETKKGEANNCNGGKDELPAESVTTKATTAEKDEASKCTERRKRHRKQVLQTRNDAKGDLDSYPLIERVMDRKSEPIVIEDGDEHHSEILDANDEVNSDLNSDNEPSRNPIEERRHSGLRRSSRIQTQTTSHISTYDQDDDDDDDMVLEDRPQREQEDLDFRLADVSRNSEKRLCPYCNKSYPNFYIHLQELHYNEWEVKKFLKVSRGSSARRIILRKWYLADSHAVSLERNNHICCSICLRVVENTAAIFHYIRCWGTRRRKKPSSSIPDDGVLLDLNRLVAAIQVEFSTKTWTDLAKCLLVSLHLFNERVPSVEKLLISDYAKRRLFKRKKEKELTEIMEECQKIKSAMLMPDPLKVIIQQNFIGVPLFMTAVQEEAADLLLKNRIEAEIPLDNNLLFGCVNHGDRNCIGLNDAIQGYTRTIRRTRNLSGFPISFASVPEAGPPLSKSAIKPKCPRRPREGFKLLFTDSSGDEEPTPGGARVVDDQEDSCSIDIKDEFSKVVERDPSMSKILREMEMKRMQDLKNPILETIAAPMADASVKAGEIKDELEIVESEPSVDIKDESKPPPSSESLLKSAGIKDELRLVEVTEETKPLSVTSSEDQLSSKDSGACPSPFKRKATRERKRKKLTLEDNHEVTSLRESKFDSCPQPSTSFATPETNLSPVKVHLFDGASAEEIEDVAVAITSPEVYSKSRKKMKLERKEKKKKKSKYEPTERDVGTLSKMQYPVVKLTTITPVPSSGPSTSKAISKEIRHSSPLPQSNKKYTVKNIKYVPVGCQRRGSNAMDSAGISDSMVVDKKTEEDQLNTIPLPAIKLQIGLSNTSNMSDVHDGSSSDTRDQKSALHVVKKKKFKKSRKIGHIAPLTRNSSTSDSSNAEAWSPIVCTRKELPGTSSVTPLVLHPPKASSEKPSVERVKNGKEKKSFPNLVNDVYKCFYLRTGKNANRDDRKRKILDVRDLSWCKNCKKYFLRRCLLKHRRLCLRRSISGDIATRKYLKGQEKRAKTQNKHRDLSTLQSPAGAKKYFCIFCTQTFTRLNRHLEHMHKDEEEVKEMLKYPKRSAERERILYRLRTKGTFAFNVNAEYNRGRIIVSRRPNPSWKRTSGDFLPCPSCHNYFAKKTLYRHTRRCSNKEGPQKDVRRTALALISSSHPRCNKTMATLVIPRLADDEVSETIKKDELLILLGNHLTRKHPATKGKGYYIRQILRIASKLFLAFKAQNPSVAEFSALYNVKYCGSVLEALKNAAGYSAETDSFKLPEIARKLHRLVGIAGQVWSMECSKTKRFEDRQMVAQFLSQFGESCKKEVLAKLTRIKEKVSVNSLRKVFEFTRVGMMETSERLRKDFSGKAWVELTNYLLVHLRLLNNNIQDGAGLYVSDYLQRHSLDADEDLAQYHTLGPLPLFPKNYLKVKLRNSPAYLLLSQEFCCAVDVLLENREDAGVPVGNLYLFGKPAQKNSHYITRHAENFVEAAMSETKALPDDLPPKANPEPATVALPKVEEEQKTKTNEDTEETTYSKNIKKAFEHHSKRMLEMTEQLRENFSNQVWIELVKCTLTCVQLTNDKTYAEVVQYLLLIDYNERELVEPNANLSKYSSLGQYSRRFYKITMRGTPITLLLSLEICEALELLIDERPRANIDEENPYVFACSGNKYNYYRSEGCIGSLPVSDGVEEILSLRFKIINDLIKNGSAGIQLWKLLPESNEDLTENTTRVFYYAQSKMVELKYKLEEKFSCEMWLELIKCLLAYVHLLNDRCAEEPERLLITDYHKRQSLDSGEVKQAYHSLDDTNDFPQNYLKVKVGDGRFLLVSLDFCETADLLLKHRQDCGVHGDNPYVFGCRGNKENFLRGHGVLAQVAGRCGVKRLKYFKAKRTLSGKVELQEHTIDVKDASRTERDILLNRWKISQSRKSANNSPADKTDERESNFIPRRRWTPEEMAVARKDFVNCLTKGYLPSVFQCQQVIAANVELRHRTPEQLKAWVNNQIQKRWGKPRGSRAHVTPPDANDDQHRERQRPARLRWSSAERELVSVYFADNLTSHTLPSAGDCRKVITSHEQLSQRTPGQLRAWINNQNKKRIAAEKCAAATGLSNNA